MRESETLNVAPEALAEQRSCLGFYCMKCVPGDYQCTGVFTVSNMQQLNWRIPESNMVPLIISVYTEEASD